MGCDYDIGINTNLIPILRLVVVVFNQIHKLTIFMTMDKVILKRLTLLIQLTIVSSQESISIFVFELKERKDGYVNTE